MIGIGTMNERDLVHPTQLHPLECSTMVRQECSEGVAGAGHTNPLGTTGGSSPVSLAHSVEGLYLTSGGPCHDTPVLCVSCELWFCCLKQTQCMCQQCCLRLVLVMLQPSYCVYI